jgi:hypothetical protein
MAKDWNLAELHIGGVNGAWCGNSRYARSQKDLDHQIIEIMDR